MPDVIGEAFVAIRPDTHGFATEAQTGIKSGLSTAAKGLLAAGVGFKVGQFLKGAFDEATEAAKVGAQTAAVIKSTGGAAEVSAKHVGELADKLSDLAGIDDEIIAAGENVLLTFTNIKGAQFDKATKAALNLSVAMKTDLRSSALLVGKALQDPEKGMTALVRAGVRLSDDQQEQIKNFQEVGDLASAQKIILGELAKEFGGSAEAQATEAERASVAWGNLKETLGTALLPVIASVSRALIPLLKYLSEHKGLVLALAGLIAGALVAAFTAWAVSAAAAAAATLAAAAPVLIIGAAILGLIAVTVALYLKWDEVWNLMKDHPAIAIIIILMTSAISVPILALVVTLQFMKDKWDDVWRGIQTVTEAVWSVIEPILNAIDRLIHGIIDAVLWLGSASADAFNGFRDNLVAMWHIVDGPLNALLDVLRKIVNTAEHAADLVGKVKNIGGAAIPDVTPGFDVPGVPFLAAGGIVTRPTLAVIGESGPEAVIPLSSAQARGGGVHFHFTGGAPVNPVEAGHLAARTYRVHMQMAGR